MFLKLTLDPVTGKKNLDFGASWGSMSKAAANAAFVPTGDGLVVVDIDIKDLEGIDKRITDYLGDPTVITTRGYHWYYTVIDSKRFKSRAAYSEHVDIRSDGGLVISEYWGDEPLLYSKVGETVEMPLGLEEYLLYLMEDHTGAVGSGDDLPSFGEQWSDPSDGQRHDASLNYIIRDYRNGVTEKQTEDNYKSWLDLCGIRQTDRELSIMRKRMQGALKYSTPSLIDGDILEDEPVELVEEARDADIAQMIIDKVSINDVIDAVSNVEDDFRREEYAQSIKKAYTMPIKMVRDSINTKRKDTGMTKGVDSYFDGNHVVWDPDMQVFCEVNHQFVQMHGKNGFAQTLSSRTNIARGETLNELLAAVPAVYVRYQPDAKSHEGEYTDKYGRDAINVYQGVRYAGAGRRIPRLIGLALDNLFGSQPEHQEVFINWLAFIVQTGQRTGVAWGFFGVQGSGKGLVSYLLRELVGHANASMEIGDTDLQSQFNSYMINKQFVHLNEIASDFHGRHGVAGKLKRGVSDGRVRVNQKGINEVEVDNYANFILNSNRKQPIELDKDDRRWNMVVTNKALTECEWWYDGAYEDAIGEWKRFGAYLMKYDLDAAMARRPIPLADQPGKAQVISLTTPVLDQVMNFIDLKDAEKLVDLLELDEDDILYSMIMWANSNGKWSSDVMLEIFKSVTEDQNASKTKMVRRMITQYKTHGVYELTRDADESGARTKAYSLKV